MVLRVIEPLGEELIEHVEQDDLHGVQHRGDNTRGGADLRLQREAQDVDRDLLKESEAQ